MRARVLGVAGGAMFALTGASAASEVVFDAKTIRLTVRPGEVAREIGWTYANRGELPLVIEGYDGSCGCLTGMVDPLEAPAVAPGGSGRILASFTPGPYRGVVRKSLHVRFVGIEKPVELVAEVTIPSSVELSVRELKWESGDAASKMIEVTSGTGAEFTVTGLVGVAADQFIIEPETVTEGRHYRLSITPAKSVRIGTHCLQLGTDSLDPRDRTLAVFLHVEPSTQPHAEP